MKVLIIGSIIASVVAKTTASAGRSLGSSIRLHRARRKDRKLNAFCLLGDENPARSEIASLLKKRDPRALAWAVIYEPLIFSRFLAWKKFKEHPFDNGAVGFYGLRGEPLKETLLEHIHAYTQDRKIRNEAVRILEEVDQKKRQNGKDRQ